MEKEEKIKVNSYGGRNPGSISISGFTEEELEKMLGSINGGMWWVRVVNGRLKFYANYERLPSPMEDPDLMPFWRRVTKNEKEACSYALIETEPISEYSTPTIIIQHLCGYYYSPEGYKHEAEKLESYGFDCLRSRRESDGKFWEIWYLPFLELATGELKKVIACADEEKNKLKLTLEFLSKNVSFGSLNVSVQRLAMPVPD